MNQKIEWTRGSHFDLAKAAGLTDPDEQTLDAYIGQLGAPDTPSDDYDTDSALRDSHLIGANLAKCKIAEMQCDHDKLGKHLDVAIAHHGRLHGALHAAAARASEINSNAVREGQEED